MLNRFTATLCTAVTLSLAATAASAQAPIQLSIGLSSGGFAASAPRIADQLGLFTKHGLAVKNIIFDSGALANAALVGGSVQATSAGPQDVVISTARGIKMVTINSVYGGYAGVAVLSKEAVAKSGVSPTAPFAERFKALDGLLIASPSATTNYTLSPKCVADKLGVKLRFTYLAQPSMPTALETKVVDAYVAGSPFYAVPVFRGNGVVWLNGPKGEFPKECVPANAVAINMTRAYAEANPEVVKRIRAVFVDFAKMVREEPDKVKAVVQKTFSDLDPKLLDLVWQTESNNYAPPPLSREDMAREIGYIVGSGVSVPGIENVKPEDLMIP